MIQMKTKLVPHAREDGLVIEEYEDELLVYDLDRDKAHCLNETAAMIWHSCDGKRSVPEIAARIRSELRVPVDDEVVWVALRRLGKARLLRDRVNPPLDANISSSRRDLMRKLAVVGGLSVITIISPTAAEAATGCTMKVSCKHLCISNHSVKSLPCPGGKADEQNGQCCGDTKGVCHFSSVTLDGDCGPENCCTI